MKKQYMLLLIILINNVIHGVTNWKLPDPRLRIDQIHFLGSHNAFLNKEDGWTYAQQKWSVPKQLDHGVRFLEMDLGKDNNHLAICHGQCAGKYKLAKGASTFIGLDGYVSFKDAFKNITAWLLKPEHKKEIVIIALDIGREKTLKPNDVDDELSTLKDVNSMILTPSEWNPDEHDGDWPTLQWMRNHKKQIIILNGQKDNSPKYTYYQWRYVGGTPPGNTEPAKSARMRRQSLEAFTDDNERAKIQRIFQLNHASDVSEKYVSDIATAGSKVGVVSKENAKKIKEKSKISDNKRTTIQAVIDECKKQNIMNGKNPNILFFDWTHKFINDNGLEMINEWNDEAAKNL